VLPSVRFDWNPILVALRREVCPLARWHKQGRHWAMRTDDVQAFIDAAHTRLEFSRQHAQVRVDDVTWMVGFVRGAPYRLDRAAVV
jgi:hypothetical protein